MSSDGYFDGDDEFDAAAFAQMDAIEAAYAASNPSRASSLSANTVAPTVTKPKSPTKEASFYDLTLDLDEEEMGKLDAFIADSYANMEKPKSKTGSMRQTTLHGDILPRTPQPSKTGPSGGMQRTVSSPRNVFGSKSKKTKVWDQTAFAKTGQRKKGKGRRFDESEEEEEVEFEQFPAPFVSPGEPRKLKRSYSTRPTDTFSRWPPPMKLKPDLLEAKHWVYPLNKPKRDFQYNIVKHSLFENTIISVPTGMGKTFIAGVVMLNYYRWFPDGKVVFVAPTRPLVAQQIHASHKSCGIPGSDAAEMTGEVSRAKREKLWREKRVFYMTPQTLMNDLTSENCDVMDIVLLIVDEAHRATGDYAYNQIVRHMMAKNPHFRLIALTATPGKDTEAVQNLVDGLHISRIEIRNEESIDLRGYMHDKNVEQHCIKMPEGISAIRDALERLMETYLKPLQAMGIMWPNQHAVKLHPYAARAKISTLAPHQRGFVHQLSMLGNLAQVMAYLLEATVGMAYSYLKEISEKDMDDQARKNQQAQSKKLRENVLFKKTLAAFESYRSTTTGSFLNHPKMEKATDILVKYYGQMLPENDDDESEENWGRSKAMVFVTHREAVDEIVEALNSHQPMLRASRFVGQGADKNGKKGQTQKEQLEVIDKFQKGTFNVLVATCVGEEGLDIGEVDLIICYDAQKTPIRMLQRFGRTGRERAGFVHVLLAEEREEFNLEKARLTYKEVQRAISRGDDLEFYSDVKRLLPDHIKPLPLERIMEIKPYVREETSKAKRSPRKPKTKTKRKRNDDVMRNIPDGACTGFVSVADLIVNQSKRRKVVDVKTLDDEAEDDDLDKALEAGVDGLLCGKRTKSFASPSRPWDEDSLDKPISLGKMERARSGPSRSTTKSAAKAKSRKKLTDADGSEVKGKKGGKTKRKGKKKETSLSLSQQGRDDSVDRELEDNPFVRETSRTRKTLLHGSPISPSHSHSPETPKRRAKIWTSSPSPVHEAITPDPLDQEQRRLTPFTQMGSRLNDRNDPDDLTWVINDDDDDPDIVILSSSPVALKDESHDDSIGKVDTASPHSHEKVTRRSETQSQPMDRSVLELSSDMQSSPPRSLGTSPVTKLKKDGCSPSSVYKSTLGRKQAFETTQPIRRAIRRPLRHNLSVISSSDAEIEMPLPSQRRLRRLQDSSPEPEGPKPKQKKRKPLTKRKHNALLDYTAEHSGGDVSSGLSNSDDDVESESDRHFIKDSPMTQIPSSYDQTLMYRKSLMTQAPVDGPDFHEGPIRNKPFGRMEPRKRRRVVDSSPPPEDDGYEFGSFVVDNDAEISYLTQVDEF